MPDGEIEILKNMGKPLENDGISTARLVDVVYPILVTNASNLWYMKKV